MQDSLWKNEEKKKNLCFVFGSTADMCKVRYEQAIVECESIRWAFGLDIWKYDNFTLIHSFTHVKRTKP